MKILIIARLTFHEARRRRIVLAALVLGLAFLVLYGVGYHFVYREMLENFGLDSSDLRLPSGPSAVLSQVQTFTDPFTMAGMYVVNFLLSMMAVLTSVDTLSGEISSGAIQSVVSKPIGRWEVVLGKWLGYAVMLGLYLLYMAGGVLLIAQLVAGYTPPNVPHGLLLMWLQALILITVTLFGGAILSTLANGVLAFGLFGLGFIGGFIELLGAGIRNETAVRVGIISSLIIPTTSLWNRASSLMSQSAISQLGITPFSPGSTPSPQMVTYALAYLLIFLVAAVWRFSKRDL